MCVSSAIVQPLADLAQNRAALAPHKANVIGAGKIFVKVVQMSGEEILVAELEPNVQGAVLRSLVAFALEQPVDFCKLINIANGRELRANLSVADSGLVDGETITAFLVPGARPVDNAHLGVVEGQGCSTGLKISLSHVEARGLSTVTLSGQANITGARGSLKAGDYYFYVELKAALATTVTFSELVNVRNGVSEVLWMAS